MHGCCWSSCLLLITCNSMILSAWERCLEQFVISVSNEGAWLASKAADKGNCALIFRFVPLCWYLSWYWHQKWHHTRSLGAGINYDVSKEGPRRGTASASVLISVLVFLWLNHHTNPDSRIFILFSHSREEMEMLCSQFSNQTAWTAASESISHATGPINRNCVQNRCSWWRYTQKRQTFVCREAAFDRTCAGNSRRMLCPHPTCHTALPVETQNQIQKLLSYKSRNLRWTKYELQSAVCSKSETS